MNRRLTPSTRSRHAAPTLAAVLLLTTLLGVVPARVLFASSDPAMDCCKGMGGAMKNSCPFLRRTGLKRRQKPAQFDPLCGARAAAASFVEATLARGSRPELFPATSTEGDGSELTHDQQDPSPDATTAPRVSSAAVSKPCPADCCCQSKLLARTRRTHDEAATSNRLRPRAPTLIAASPLSRAASVHISEPRRQHLKRGPPSTTVSPSA